MPSNVNKAGKWVVFQENTQAEAWLENRSPETLFSENDETVSSCCKSTLETLLFLCDIETKKEGGLGSFDYGS